MILGYCSPQVGMAGAPWGPLGSQQKREGNGELKERRLTDAIISFSFITLGYFRLGRKGKITQHRIVGLGLMCQKVFEINSTTRKKGIIFIFKHHRRANRRSLTGQLSVEKHPPSSSSAGSLQYSGGLKSLKQVWAIAALLWDHEVRAVGCWDLRQFVRRFQVSACESLEAISCNVYSCSSYLSETPEQQKTVHTTTVSTVGQRWSREFS